MTLELWQAIEAGNKAQELVAKKAGVDFMQKAAAQMLAYLALYREATGEDLTDACLSKGIKPENDKAFGPVISYLSRSGQIERAGYAQRRKGHGTSGAIIWKLKQN